MKRALLALVALAALIPFGIGASSATFVAASSNPNATFSTAADFNTVAVTLTDPGTPLRGTVALTATAASDRGLASVTFQSSPAGANTWTNLCVDTVAPYTCDFDTLSVADGLRDIRAVALDTAGYSRESARVRPPDRQHRSGDDADRSGQPADRHARRSPPPPPTAAPASPRSRSSTGSAPARGRRSARRPPAASRPLRSPTARMTCARS